MGVWGVRRGWLVIGCDVCLRRRWQFQASPRKRDSATDRPTTSAGVPAISTFPLAWEWNCVRRIEWSRIDWGGGFTHNPRHTRSIDRSTDRRSSLVNVLESKAGRAWRPSQRQNSLADDDTIVRRRELLLVSTARVTVVSWRGAGGLKAQEWPVARFACWLREQPRGLWRA
jgi:hypothetical protein